MNSKDRDNVPLRCQRLLMRLMRFKPVAAYAPGKTLVVADTLSQSPLSHAGNGSDTHSEVKYYIAAVMVCQLIQLIPCQLIHKGWTISEQLL